MEVPPEIHRKRCKRYNVARHSHFLTFSCYRRQAFLSKDRAREWFSDAILQARAKHSFLLIAYVFMPEHAHLLIHPTEDEYDISTILHAMKAPVGRAARSFLQKTNPLYLRRHGGRFWQAGGGYDRNIFTADELWEKIGYIHRNPVRRGLVTKAEEWHWSSAGCYKSGSGGPLPVDNQDLPTLW